MTNQPVLLNVNGRGYRLQIAPETPLLYILRNDLGLMGARYGCGLEQCGACKVLVDGEAVPSCRLPVAAVQGKEIITLEGLGTLDRLHPLQQAFIEEQAIQCGFCVGGMIVVAKALLECNPHPTESQIREALAYHICRCGVHHRIIKAIKRAAREMGS